MQWRLPVALLVAAGVVVGCSALIDFDGLTGGSVGDASINNDARDEAQPSNAACDGATFCDTFDTLPFGATWTATEISGGATITLDDGGALSPPYGARLFMPSRTASTNRMAQLRKTLATPGSKVSCAVDLRIDEMPASGDTGIMTLWPTGPAVNKGEIYVSISHNQSTLYQTWGFLEGGGASTSVNFGVLATGAWIHVVLETDYLTSSVTVNSLVVATANLIVTTPPTSLDVSVGERSDEEQGQTSVLFDNYACVVTP